MATNYKRRKFLRVTATAEVAGHWYRDITGEMFG